MNKKLRAWFDGIPVTKGGPGSGNWGHAGRKGQRGGSLPKSSAMSLRTGPTAQARQQEAGQKKPSKKAIDFVQMSKEERDSVIRNLKPDDVLKMHHGTRSPETALKLCREGFDPSERPKEGRIYHGALAPKEGYFVSPWRDVSTSFGGHVVEFETPAKKMIGPPERGLPKGETADDFWRSAYPNSFRPSLSAGLRMGESQGLLVDKISPEDVKGVWRYAQAGRSWFFTSRRDFLREMGG
jgi:hypothetical protein